MWNRVYTFKQMQIDPVAFNGWPVCEADRVMSELAFSMLWLEFPEMRWPDREYFDFQVDWLGHEVVVTECDTETIG